MTRLTIDGVASSPCDLGFEELAALPGQVPDIETLLPGRQGGAVRLAAILDAAATMRDATHITLTSSDGRFSASVPLDSVPDAVVAYRLGDAPLPESLGGPLRFFIPQADQCASGVVDRCANVKFLARLHLTAGPGADTRPTTDAAHQQLHDEDSHRRGR